MKVLLITHKPDIDGVTPVILSKIVFGKVDYLLLETYQTNVIIPELIDKGIFDNYDKVYITDLSITKDVCNKINNNQALRNKAKVFDHHNSHLFVNEYDFAQVVDINEEGNKECGTSLYYKYLLSICNSPILRKASVKQFVELVRQYDTWEWLNKYNNLDAKRLTDLFNIFGEGYFIKYYYDFLINNDDFYYSDKENYILDIEQTKINRYIEEKSQEIIPIELLGYSAGLIFSENYRSELGSALARKYKEVYDFIIIINLARGVSYRGTKDIDLGHIASIFGGKGHINSSGSPLPRGLKEEVIRKIFNEKVEIINDKKDFHIEEQIISF